MVRGSRDMTGSVVCQGVGFAVDLHCWCLSGFEYVHATRGVGLVAAMCVSSVDRASSAAWV